MNFGRYCPAVFIYDGINLFNDVEIGLVIGVFHPRATPGHIGKLPRWKSFTNTK